MLFFTNSVQRLTKEALDGLGDFNIGGQLFKLRNMQMTLY